MSRPSAGPEEGPGASPDPNTASKLEFKLRRWHATIRGSGDLSLAHFINVYGSTDHPEAITDLYAYRRLLAQECMEGLAAEIAFISPRRRGRLENFRQDYLDSYEEAMKTTRGEREAMRPYLKAKYGAKFDE